ncbi:porin family protein [Mesonia maritima]|uniref:Outer membrane protein beta-barrel domain-containing protein n=1 Tax=Mesonia maritima TaxID=1793873 RepID=A0ABU1K3X9_9FLAO|nr:porin family protein [Mesonia maritima]MDR6300303.1 hypothetical protein [Mesonia maritima]
MRKLIFLVTVMLFVGNLKAQEVDFGIKAGANFATLSDVDNADRKTGFQGGIFAGVKFNDSWGIQADLLYSQQGSEFDADKVNLDYINIPVVLKYYLIGGLNLQAGPQFGFMVNDDFPEANEIGDQIETNDFDISGAFGVGLDLAFGLRLDARYNLGFTDVSDNTKGKNAFYSVTIGYSFL